MGNIGIIGRARSGKDTMGKWLVDNRGYKRVAFADPLKEAALALDPIVGTDNSYRCTEGERLSAVVSFWGWERAKEEPEVRRILQELGASIRAIDPEFWLRAALAKVQEANEGGQLCVITDVRYPNEVDSLRRAGVHLVYIDRPGTPQLDHESERLTALDADYTIVNYGLRHADFYADVERFVERVYRAESSKQYGRSFA